MPDSVPKQGKLTWCLCWQQKLKEEREAKRSQLDERHNYILQTVADSLGLEYSEVEDAILEGTQVTSVLAPVCHMPGHLCRMISGLLCLNRISDLLCLSLIHI